jgi:RHS repeat-associated protein
MPSRSFSASSYKYGFNGKEKDDEVKGGGNSVDFGARIYDSRLGRWLSIDPMSKKYSSYSPYAFAKNNPITNKDYDGKDIVPSYNLHMDVNERLGIPNTPQRDSDLGVTKNSYTYDLPDDPMTGKVMFNVSFDIYLSPVFSSSHPKNKEFEANNPGKKEFVALHEYSHTDQYMEIITKGDFVAAVNNIVVEGNVDQVMNNAYQILRDDYIKKNGLPSSGGDVLKMQSHLAIAVDEVFNQVVDQIDEKYNEKYPLSEDQTGGKNDKFSINAEVDANKRAVDKAEFFDIKTDNKTVFPKEEK